MSLFPYHFYVMINPFSCHGCSNPSEERGERGQALIWESEIGKEVSLRWLDVEKVGGERNYETVNHTKGETLQTSGISEFIQSASLFLLRRLRLLSLFFEEGKKLHLSKKLSVSSTRCWNIYITCFPICCPRFQFSCQLGIRN